MSMQKIRGSDISKGQVLEIEEKGSKELKLYRVLDIESVKPGKGGRFTQAKLRALDKKGAIKIERFSADAVVRVADVRQVYGQYSWKGAEGYHCYYSDEGGSQIDVVVNRDCIEDSKLAALLQGEEEVILFIYEDEVISLTLPIKMECLVQALTNAGSELQALLKGGIKIRVPSHISVGDRILIDSRSREFESKVNQTNSINK